MLSTSCTSSIGIMLRATPTGPPPSPRKSRICLKIKRTVPQDIFFQLVTSHFFVFNCLTIIRLVLVIRLVRWQTAKKSAFLGEKLVQNMLRCREKRSFLTLPLKEMQNPTVIIRVKIVILFSIQYSRVYEYTR